MDTDYIDEEAAPVNRMVIAIMALVGLMISVYTLLFKLGVVGTFACGSGACEFVQLSPFATQLGIPVPVWGLAGYGVMLVVAVLGLNAFLHRRWVAMTLLAGGIGGFLFSAYLSYLEAYRIHAWCRWCLGSAAVATIMFLASLPEFRRIRQ
ncbi:MAG: vitamin K epoxide reductase family protein [Longimicrobiales bacterium]